MASYKSHQDRAYADSGKSHANERRSYRDDRFYDERYDEPRSGSRSPSPSPSQSKSRRYNSPPRRRSPPHDASRTPPRGPTSNSRYNNRYDRDWEQRGRNDGRVHDRRNHSTPSPHRGRERGSYRDRDREDYRSPSYESRSRSRSLSSREERPRRYTAPPNKEIMLEALAPDMTEEDITRELKQHYKVDGLTDVRVIRDRQTRQSRQFGFLRFSTLAQAQSFLESNQPLLYFYGNPDSKRDEPAKVRIVYSRERADVIAEGGDAEWICKVCSVNNYPTRSRCFRCQAFRADVPDRDPPQEKEPNVGDNDASPDNTPSQFLLFRGLEPSVSEELFAKGVAKLYKPSSSNVGNQLPSKKGAKVASTTGDANLGARAGTLRRVLLVRDRQTNESWRFGFAEFAAVEDAMAAVTRYNSFEKFTIASKSVMVSYVHSGVFVPVLAPGNIHPRFTFSPLANPSVAMSYWDEGAFVSEFNVGDIAKEKMSVAQKTEDSAGRGVNEGREGTKAKKRKAETTAMDLSTAKKATPSYLQRWSNQHAELHGLQPKPSTKQGGEELILKDEASAPPEPPQNPPTQSYADLSRHCCYLCSRQFKSATEVNKHERLSDLHQTNLTSEEALAKARAKLEKHGILIQSQQAEYRDRAKERRKAFGVINKKGQQVQPTKTKTGSAKKKTATEDNDDDPAPPSSSKGASLLGKMGYVAGSGKGLGATGSGMTAPIAQDVYVAGVGLGAQGGKIGDAIKEAERNTKGDYGGFLAKTRDGARERFERLG